MASWSQTHKRRSTSRRLALIYGYIWWKIHRQYYRWEDYAMNLVILVRGREEKLPDCHKVRKWPNATSKKTSSQWLQLPNRRQYRPLNFRQPGENIKREKVEDTILDLLKNLLQKDWKNEMHLPQLRQLGVILSMKLSKNNLLMRNIFRLFLVRGRYSGKRYQDLERYHRFPNKRKPQCVHSLSERPQLWGLEEDKTTRARCRMKTMKRVDGIAPSTKFGTLITTDH